jgi:hypothetical protein
MYIDEMVTDQDCDQAKGWLQYATTQADQLELQAVHDRIDIFSRKIKVRIRLHDYLAEVRTLRETFQKGINFKYFYRYPQRRAEMVLKFQQDWSVIVAAFPAVKAEAECALDLYALNHNTASVFHSMRVAEHGLRALAKERKISLAKNRPVEWANWQDIIKALGDEAKIILNKPAGAAKDRALDFYSGAIADLNGFKDEYRNLVMHVRKVYNDLQALRAYQRVRDFMERISAKINHQHYRIRWGLK